MKEDTPSKSSPTELNLDDWLNALTDAVVILSFLLERLPNVPQGSTGKMMEKIKDSPIGKGREDSIDWLRDQIDNRYARDK